MAVYGIDASIIEVEVDVSGINQLATLPSKEEIFSKLLWVINAPAQQLVTAMGGSVLIGAVACAAMSLLPRTGAESRAISPSSRKS